MSETGRNVVAVGSTIFGLALGLIALPRVLNNLIFGEEVYTIGTYKVYSGNNGIYGHAHALTEVSRVDDKHVLISGKNIEVGVSLPKDASYFVCEKEYGHYHSEQNSLYLISHKDNLIYQVKGDAIIPITEIASGFGHIHSIRATKQ